MKSRRPWIRIFTLLLCCAWFGCREAPEVVFAKARDSLASRDSETFLALLDAPSRRLLERSQRVGKKSGGTFEVLGAKGFSKELLPAGDLVEDPEDGDYCLVLSGKLCLIEVRKGRKSTRVPLRLVRGQWRIALVEMDSFLHMVAPR